MTEMLRQVREGCGQRERERQSFFVHSSLILFRIAVGITVNTPELFIITCSLQKTSSLDTPQMFLYIYLNIPFLRFFFFFSFLYYL